MHLFSSTTFLALSQVSWFAVFSQWIPNYILGKEKKDDKNYKKKKKSPKLILKFFLFYNT